MIFIPYLVFGNSPCPPSIDCSNISYPYVCCDGSIHCLTDPLTGNPHALKAIGKMCLTFGPFSGGDASGPDLIKMPDWTIDEYDYEPDYTLDQIYSESDVENDITCANDNWSCICPGLNNTGCACNIAVEYSSSVAIFPTSSNYLIQTAAKTTGQTYNTQTCFLNCSGVKIYLNGTDQFWHKDDDGFYHSGFYNNNSTDYNNLTTIVTDEGNDPAYDDSDPKTGYYALNLCDILTHELGHLYGFGDNYIYHCSGSSIMDGGTWNAPYQGLSENDKCGFQKLYCNITDVNEKSTKTSNEVFPNPSENITYLKITSDNIVFNANLIIADMLGRTIKTMNINVLSQGENTIQLNNEDLTTGTYFYRLQVGSVIKF